MSLVKNCEGDITYKRHVWEVKSLFVLCIGSFRSVQSSTNRRWTEAENATFDSLSQIHGVEGALERLEGLMPTAITLISGRNRCILVLNGFWPYLHIFYHRFPDKESKYIS